MPENTVLRRVKPAVYDDSDEEAIGLGSRSSRKADPAYQAGGAESEEEDEKGEEDYEYDDDEVMDGYNDKNSEDDEKSSEEDEIDATAVLSHTSFGTLAKAESAIAQKRSRTTRVSETSKENRISAVKSQLQALNLPTTSKKTGSNSTPIKPDRPEKPIPPKRTSKSAPAEQTSKRPVSRYRDAVELNNPKARDPRFDDAAGNVNEAQFKKNYAFLKEYKESEIGALKEEIGKRRKKKKQGGDEELEELERVLKRLESQTQTQEAKDRAAALVAEHRKKERELVRNGKTPYFLKRSEQKTMVLMDKYSKLGEKGLDRVLARKRKQKAAKERKNMPWARRGTEA